MGLLDVFKVGAFKAEIETQRGDISRLNKTISELGLLEIVQKQELVRKLEAEIKALDGTKSVVVVETEMVNRELADLRKQIIVTEEEILMQSFGLYSPRYEFANSDGYKEKLDYTRFSQKILIKNGLAASGSESFTFNDKASLGKKMVKDMQKLLLRAFNSECDECINHVKYNNFDSAKQRISSSRDAISKLGAMLSVAITPEYFKLKIEELHLAFEYRQKVQAEKEQAKEGRELDREAKKLEKEIEEARRAIEKEKKHFGNALAKVTAQLASATGADRDALLAKQAELEAELAKLLAKSKDIDFREANSKAGYVYIISNLGAFGNDVFKIGVTRRLEPLERVDDLGDASVPFEFDVHALIFSENAFALEAALHKAFENSKINMVNQRKEFFRIPLADIKRVVGKNFDKTVEWTELPLAEEHRTSEKMRLSGATHR